MNSCVKIAHANKSLSQGDIPIESVLVKNRELVAKGHNKSLQEKIQF